MTIRLHTARALACPFCHAQPGRPCIAPRRKSIGIALHVHRSRMRAAGVDGEWIVQPEADSRMAAGHRERGDSNETGGVIAWPLRQ